MSGSSCAQEWSGVPDAPRALLERALRERAADGSVVVISVPMPSAPLDVFLAAFSEPTASVWIPPRGPAVASVGEAWRFDPSGPDGLTRLPTEARALFARMAHVTPAGSSSISPRLFGGLSFAPGASAGAPWAPFGDGSFVLPKWSYVRDGARASLDVAMGARESEDEILGRFDTLYAALEAGPSASLLRPASEERRAAEVRQLDPGRWSERVESIRQAIRSGAFEKVVAARRADARFGRPVDPLEVLRRLNTDYPHCTRFLFSRNGASFLGATPEPLFSKRGARLFTVALAGSIAAGKDAQADAAFVERLLTSAKERQEHALVVREIGRALAPLTKALKHPGSPEIRRVREILHLETPFFGELSPEVGALDVLKAMHPTPAVGGIPRPEATAWIVREEEHPRGWYTGPVGWLDLAGDAEFVVALRCGVLDGARAHVFSGAGIMEDSDPTAEYEETRLKQQPLFRALGLSP